MTESILSKVLPTSLVVVGSLLMYMWVSGDATTGFEMRLPDPNEGIQAVSEENTVIEGHLIQYDGVASELGGSWPRFRGIGLDGISREQVKLSRKWGGDGPSVLWSMDVGEGYAGPAVFEGRVYLIDYDHERQADAIRCFSLDDGSEIWRYWYPVAVRRYHGMSRTVPMVTEKYVVTLGPKCHVTCLDRVTGEFGWMLDLVKDYGAKVPQWYAGQCPLIDDGKAIIAVGGKVLMMAVDCNSGETVWTTPNPNRWKMTHSSVLPIDFNGRRMYVYCGSGGVVGVSADDGSILWEYIDWKIVIANVPTPVVVGDGEVLLSGGYNAGCMMLKLREEAGKIVAQQFWRLKSDVFSAAQHTPIFYEGYIYGVRQDGQFVCLNTDGEVIWSSGKGSKFGLGPYIIADGLIYVLNDSGLLTMAEASSTGYNVLGRAQVLEGPESWGAPAIASGRLIVRDMNRMTCLDVSGQ